MLFSCKVREKSQIIMIAAVKATASHNANAITAASRRPTWSTRRPGTKN